MSLLTKHRKLLMITWFIIMLCISSIYCKASDMNEAPVQNIEPTPIATPTLVPESTPKQTQKTTVFAPGC